VPSCRQKTPANHAAVPPAKKLKSSCGGAKASGKENTAGKNQSGGRQVSLKAAAVCCAGKACVKVRSVSGVPQCDCRGAENKRREEEEFITSGNWRGKHNSLSLGAGAGVAAVLP
jgi:hypothetical protein